MTAQRANRARRDRSAELQAGASTLAPDAFFLADLEGRFTNVNQAACRMLGYAREELVGKTILDIIPAEDAPRLASVKTALLVPGQVHTGEWTHRRKDGTSFPVEVSANIRFRMARTGCRSQPLADSSRTAGRVAV